MSESSLSARRPAAPEPAQRANRRQARAHPRRRRARLREEGLPRDARERGREGGRRRRRDHLPLLQVARTSSSSRSSRTASSGCSRSCTTELPQGRGASEKLRRIIELQLGLLEGERDLAEVVTVILRQSTKLMKEYAAPKFTAYLDAIARVVADGQATRRAARRRVAAPRRARDLRRARRHHDDVGARQGGPRRARARVGAARRARAARAVARGAGADREAAARARARARATCARFFDARGFLEVQTPLARPLAGARPAPRRLRGGRRRPRRAPLAHHVARVPDEAPARRRAGSASTRSRRASGAARSARATTPSSRCSSGTARTPASTT